MKNKKLVALLLTAAMLCVTACGSTGKTEAPAPAPEKSEETEAPAEELTEESEEAEAPAETTADADLTPIDNYPASSLQITVPPSAGGGTDTLIRQLAIYMEEYLNVPVTVVNKSGGGCAIGFAAGATDPNDGSCITAGVAELNGLPYTTDFEYSYKDFEPICNFNACYGTICVPAAAPYDTVEDFVDYMKENPGKVRFSNSGIGGPWHLLAAKFASIADVDIVHVPCDGGGPAAIAAAGGNVECVPVSDAECKTYLDSGLLKMLMTFSPERLEAFPEVPTAAECGYGEASSVVVYRGFLAPKGTSQEVLDAVDAATRYALAQPEVQEFMQNNSFTSNYMDAAAFGELLSGMDKICDEMTQELGIAVEK
ncbi:MAG: tripartite tricarboxylate transporter substrate binding protein [Clostridiales bacterium]|nr:tripartite tricarboxylate transporter substrate binding protein [Clostridiales bacterium]